MRLIVGVGDMKVSTDPSDEIVTHALGSCLGVMVHDPVARVGGLLHVMLPQCSINPADAKENPAKYVDSGLKYFLGACAKLGARKERSIVSVAGGASVGGDGQDHFQIGKRNMVALRKALWQLGILIKAEDTGGAAWRTVILSVATGRVEIKMADGVSVLVEGSAVSNSPASQGH